MVLIASNASSGVETGIHTTEWLWKYALEPSLSKHLLRHSRKKELVDDLNLARLVKSDGGHHVGQRLLVGRSGGNHFGNLFRKMFWVSGEKPMGLELKRVDKNEGRTKMYVSAGRVVC